MQEKVLPIKDTNVLKDVEETLKDSFKFGIRNYTIFQVGKSTLLRVSDVIKLKFSDVYDGQGNVKRNAYIHDKKTGKPNYLYLKPVKNDLINYKKWLDAKSIKSEWLFPSSKNGLRHIAPHQFYKIMAKVGDLLGIDYLGTHTMRKTGAYRVYVQSNYNISLVMSLLNHSSEKMTLAYLGLDRESRESMLDKINFG